MPNRTLLLGTVMAAIALLCASAAAQAQQKYEVVISGGDLPADVVIPVEELDRLLSEGHVFWEGVGPNASPPDTIPAVTYKVNVYQVFVSGDRLPYVFSTYYPSGGDGVARLQDSKGRWLAADPAFQELLDRYIASALSGTPVVTESGDSDGAPLLWYIAPSLAAAAAIVLAAGLTGRKLLRRKPGG